MESQTRLAIGIATHNRPTILAETIAFLAKQTRQPDKIFIAYAKPADVANAPSLFPNVTFIQTELGLTRQRNAILTLARDHDILCELHGDEVSDGGPTRRCYFRF